MTSTFLGKWRLYIANSYNGGRLDAYSSYTVTDEHKNVHPGMCLWFVRNGAFPAGKETNIGFFLRGDSKLCFMMNNGKYVGPDFKDTLAEAVGFVFSGRDPAHLPPSFKTKIQCLRDNMFLYDVAYDSNWYLTSGMVEQYATSFTITQVSPAPATVQATGKGDGADFSWLDLTGVKLTNCTLKQAQFNNCILVGTDFSGSNLSAANFDQVDLTGVAITNSLAHFFTDPLAPPSPADPRATFFGSRLNQSFLGNEWSRLNLMAATILNLSSPLSSKDKPLKAKYSILTSLNNNNLSNLKLPYAVFDHAILDDVNLNGADLSNASFIQASMHNAVLSNATLKNADMTGAQLGILAHLFTLPADYESLPQGVGVDALLRNHFAEHDITLSANVALDMQAPDRVWQLQDLDNEMTYTIRREDESSALTVYGPGVSASLINAYMPDAVLTGANLYGVVASGAQLYGSKARVDGGAILEKVQFNDANLSNLNLTQASLYGANLSGAHLFNAKFNKANLSPAPDGVVTNLSRANLQGADFSDAQLYGANLTNAAVAINVPTKVNPKQGGVYLFSLPYGGDTHTLQQYTTELTAAANSFFSVNSGSDADLKKYLDALKTNNVGPFKIVFLKHQITLSTNAQLNVVERDSVWQIVDGDQSYTLWTSSNKKGKTELYASKSMTSMQAGFNRRSMTLRWQASASLDTDGQVWMLDNDSENSKNTLTGYMRFIVKLNGKVLDVYGTALRILRLGNNNQAEFDTELCQVTILSEVNMRADTVLPNGSNLSVNQSSSGKSWDTLWLRAAEPPRPPDCVPTDFNWCPPKKDE